jgi:hypothetical protein
VGPSELLRKLVGGLDLIKVPYLRLGSVAISTYGEPRFTNDIDVVVDLRLELADQFCGLFPPDEFCCYREAVVEAVRKRHHFNIIHYELGIKIDVFIPAPEFAEESLLARARRVTIEPGFNAWFASPEDVILKKLEYYREGGSDKHISDIAGILKIQGERVDRDYLSAAARRLGLEKVWLGVLERIESL